VTLTDTAGVANQARMAILIATGTPGTTRNIVAPSQSKTYIVINQADASVVLKGSATTGVAVRAGQAATCVWNGADFEIVASGDVDGPASATDNAITRYDGTTGKLIQNSGVTIDDSNNVSGVVQLNATTVDTTNIEVTNLKAKDGTAAGSIADSTGVVTLTTLASTTGNITTVNATTVDTTNIEVTNLKAKDGTAAGSIADSTGVVTLASSVLTTTDINGGTIDGVTIGGASAGAGTFTSLTDSGNLTFTGTGNRITGDFSNATLASRAFFQTSTTNGATSVGAITNGTGATSNFAAYGWSDPNNAQLTIMSTTGGVDSRITSTFVGTPPSGTYLPMTFYTGGSERVRVDTSGNVGIGTASPTGKLDIVTAETATAINSNNATNTGFVLRYTPNLTLLGNNFSQPLALLTNDTERMRIDASGNVGIGVTPSAWSTGNSIRAIQFGGGSLYTFDNDRFFVGQNVAFLSGGASYVNAAAASLYRQQSGTHAWFTAPSGTAGNAISFTQAMTLDALGNVGIGTSSPGARLAVDSGSTELVANFNSTAAGGNYIRFQNSGTSIGDIGAGASLVSGGAAGDFGITSRSGSLILGTSSTERARIDTSGRLLVGTTAPQTETAALIVRGASGIRGSAIFEVQNTTGSFTQCFFINPNGVVGSITTDGSATAYNTSSDYRLKENVTPMQNALATVAALKPVTYTWKADGSNGQGFIAHELQAVVPDCVTGEKDAVDAEGKPKYQGVDTSFLVATLVSALQEQQAMIATQSELIQDLTTRLTTLEGN
jgi:hypothetical protein